MRVDIDNWRWANVPFYLRTGNRMPIKRSETVFHFKQLPHNIFTYSYRNLPANKLIIRLEPNEGVELHMLKKEQGINETIQLRPTNLDLSFSD